MEDIVTVPGVLVTVAVAAVGAGALLAALVELMLFTGRSPRRTAGVAPDGHCRTAGRRGVDGLRPGPPPP